MAEAPLLKWWATLNDFSNSYLMLNYIGRILHLWWINKYLGRLHICEKCFEWMILLILQSEWQDSTESTGFLHSASQHHLITP